jgi:exodeoxyribonuclease V alpha subunit
VSSKPQRVQHGASPKSAAEELRGTIEQVQFASDNGWCVLKIRTDHGERATLRGTAFGATAGERIQCRGAWIQHPKYGRQFDAQEIQTTPPATPDAIEKYLASGVIDGVGPHYARKLVNHFGAQLPSVLQNNPVYLETVEGIGPERRRRIAASWHKHANVRDIMMFLHQHGVGPLRAAQIHRRYGERAVGLLRENPYRLAEDLRGIGFTTADQIAARLGIAAEHEKRIDAGLRAVMQRERLAGHCAVPQWELVQRTAQLLEISRDSVASGLDGTLNAHRLVLENLTGESLVFLRSLRAAEIAVAGHIRRLQKAPPPWGKMNIEQRIETAEQRTGLKLRASQFEAVSSLLEHKVCILTGGPGTGKTTITRLIVDLLSERLSKIHLCTPTGKASRRLAQATGREAMTIHRLLRGAPGAKEFGHDAHHPLDTQVLIVDESSMIDVELMASLLEALPDSAALILVGDVDQLPSVGPGQVVHDLIESTVVHVVRLTENRRQAEHSSIIRNAYRVNRGLVPVCSGDPNEDFQWIIENDVNKISDRLVHLVSRELPQRFKLDPMRDIQALSPMRRGELGTLTLNQRLQHALSPNPAAKLTVGDAQFGVGDRLVQLTNYTDLGVFNGDAGHLLRINDVDKTFEVAFEGLRVTYDFDQIDDLALANVMTIHKAQGSEYPAVVIAFATVHYPLLSKRLLYTAMTRGLRVFLLGDERAVHIALHNQRSEIRRTGLQERLRLAA